MPRHTVRPGLAIAYDLRGPDSAPVLVLVTGLGGLKEGWFRQVRVLSEHFRVLTLDNRGMGGSDTLDVPTAMVDMAEDIILLLDALDVETAHVWGVSMGGKIAQEAALGWPERVDKVILENTSAGEAHRVESHAVSPLLAAAGASAQVWYDDLIPLLFSKRYRDANSKAMWAFARSRERHTPDPVGFARQYEAYAAFDSWDRLPALTQPTLVLLGAEDTLSDPENGLRVAERLPNATVVVVDEGGHSVHIERPDEVNRVVLDFLG